MIYLFYTRFTCKLKIESFNFFLQQLPGAFQSKILKFRNWQDAQRSLLGKALLINGMHLLGLNTYSLQNIKVTDFQRPFFDDAIDFNIAHSGEYIICAISINKVGVDIEEIKNISIYDFENNFNKQEWDDIVKAHDYSSFYKYWTKKEAFLKAIGTGINLPLEKVMVADNKISWENKEWFLYEINLDPGYIAHIATDISMPEIVVKKIDFI